MSGLILPKAVFDLHVSVSWLFGPKDADRLSDHVHAKNFRNNVSVRFYSGKLLIWIKCQCQCQVWTPRNSIWQICAEYGNLVDVSDVYIFSVFLARGGEGGVRGARRGGGMGIGFLLKVQQEGGGVFEEGEGPGGRLRRIEHFLWGGGLNILFFGPETSKSFGVLFTARLHV